MSANKFFAKLSVSVDAGKRAKARDMLKADRFQLFSEVTADQVVGVVKSQGDPDLVYSCRLASGGSYACCTQNLNVCGGLRGSLCKHLLVLLIGLVNSGELEPAVADRWVTSANKKKHVLDKEAMSARITTSVDAAAALAAVDRRAAAILEAWDL